MVGSLRTPINLLPHITYQLFEPFLSPPHFPPPSRTPSLLDHLTSHMQDWEAMVGLLLDDKAGIVLTGAEEAALIEILVCAVRRAVGTGVPPARTKGKVRVSTIL